jgi:hypothetical protein
VRIISLLAALLLSIVAFAPSSHAAPVYLVTFTANNFNHGGPAQIDGQFNTNFDPFSPPVFLNNQGAITNFQITSPSSITLPTNPFLSDIPGLIGQIGLTAFSPVVAGHNEFNLIVTLLGSVFTYSQTGSAFVYRSTDVSFAVAQVAATPIPASLVMLLTAMGGLGVAGFVRRRGMSISASAA